MVIAETVVLPIDSKNRQYSYGITEGYDNLRALKDMESDQRISAGCSVQDSNSHSQETGSIPVELSFPPFIGL